MQLRLMGNALLYMVYQFLFRQFEQKFSKGVRVDINQICN